MYHYVRHRALKHQDIVRKDIYKMLKAGIITPASLDWSSEIAAKKDDKPRLCLKYRTQNARMKADCFPLSKIEKIVDKLTGGCFFTSLDFFYGYWQIRLSNRCKEKTTLVCCFGTFQFEVMPFGLMNDPSSFQAMMSHLVGQLKFVKAYLDDVVVFHEQRKRTRNTFCW